MPTSPNFPVFQIAISGSCSLSRLGGLVEELFDILSEADPALSSGAECLVIAEQLARAANACEVASVRYAARARDCGHADRPAEWLARASGRSTRAARDALDTIESIGKCPDAEQALRRGDISSAQASEIASVPEHEQELLDLARSQGLHSVRDRARKYKLSSIPPEDLHKKQREARELHFWTDKLGMVRFSGAAPPEVGVAFRNRLDKEADREWRRAHKEGRVESREVHAFDAFMRMVAGGGSKKTAYAELVIVCDLHAYRRGHALDGELCHVIGGGPIPVEIVREMAKDAFLKAVLHDGVQIHTVKHFGRHRKAELETALNLGPLPELDGVECTDGCGRRYFLQWDHVDPFVHGGPTSFDNLKPRCGPDHRAKTERDRKAGLLQRSRAP